MQYKYRYKEYSNNNLQLIILIFDKNENKVINTQNKFHSCLSELKNFNYSTIRIFTKININNL